MASRKKLNDILISFLGSEYVYFDPPLNVQLHYPCIIYKEARPSVKFAANRRYKTDKCYEMTYITRDSEDPKRDLLQDVVQYCTINRHYISDHLYHTNYTLYY